MEREWCGRQQGGERNAEAVAFRLAARSEVSEDVYDQEIGLIRTKQRFIAEQHDLVESQLADLARYHYDPASLGLMRERSEAKLMGATEEDRRFVLEAVNAKVIVETDGKWELELQVPRQAPETTDDRLHVANSRPESDSTMNTKCLPWTALTARASLSN